MLFESYLALLLIAFIFTILSFVPVGSKKSYTSTEEGDFVLETHNFVIFFPWLAMGLFFLLSIASMDIVFINCDTTIESINTTVANFSNYTNAWSCYEYHHFDGNMAYLCGGLGLVMLVISIIFTLFWLTGGIAEGVKKIWR